MIRIKENKGQFSSNVKLDKSSSEQNSKESFTLPFSTKIKTEFEPLSIFQNKFDLKHNEEELHENILEKEPAISENKKFQVVPEKCDQISRHNLLESDEIAKKNINMFLPKDANSNSRSWPKVETRPTHEQPKDLSQSKQLINRFNIGLNQTTEAKPHPSKIKSPTNLLINKFDNPNDTNKRPAPGVVVFMAS